MSQYPGSELYGTNLTRGSIIVSTFVTVRRTKDLVDIIDRVNSDLNTTLTFTFNGTTLVPSSVLQDQTFPVTEDDHRLVLVLGATIPAGVILLCGVFLICVVCCCCLRNNGKSRYDVIMHKQS